MVDGLTLKAIKMTLCSFSAYGIFEVMVQKEVAN
jgi:hypothetical protein